MAKATVMAVVNQKGGTGKTTTCENLGVGLAMEGKKVLLVDTDPQASLTICLGHPVPDQLSPTLSDMMGKILSEQPIAPGEGILHHPEGVDLMPANIELSGLEVSLVNAMSRETILKQYLDTVKQNYDFILLDCMPSLGMLTVNALAAADNEQQDFLEAMDYAQSTPSLSQAQRLKKFSQEGKCSLDAMCAIMSEEKKGELDRVTIKHDVLRKYFPKSYTPKQMEDTIIKLLEQWQRKREKSMER